MVEGHKELFVSVCFKVISVCVCPFLVESITSTFYQWISKTVCCSFSLTSTNVMQKDCFDTPKVKVTVEGQLFKLTLSGA